MPQLAQRNILQYELVRVCCRKRFSLKLDHIPGKTLKWLPDKLKDPPNMDEMWSQWDLRERRWSSG